MTISTDSQQEIIDAISAAQDFFMQHFEKGPVDLYNKAYSHGLKLSNAKLWIKGQALTIADLDAELLAVREAQSVPVAYRYRYNGKHLASAGCGDMVSSWKYCEEADLVNPDERYEHQALFTAPPAPAPAVPAEMTADQMYQLLMEKGGVMSPVGAAVFAHNACRAKVLAAAPTPTKAAE